MVLGAGLKKQRKKRTYLRIRREVEVREGNKLISAHPAPGYTVAYKINFAQPIGAQSFEIDLSQDLYRKEVAAARTFGFLSEEKALKNMGLIRGASEQNVIVLTATGIKNGPLRFPDEFVRHKVLDLIGDLALLGKQIIGHIVADRAGHAMHTALVSRLLRDRSLWEETTEVVEPEELPESVTTMAAPRASEA
jgi:UDP-3-O-[3-hydroxymyristoyl] N-acetylglucosamine deacetylase